MIRYARIIDNSKNLHEKTPRRAPPKKSQSADRALRREAVAVYGERTRVFKSLVGQEMYGSEDRCIYVVVVRAVPDAVKVGMTRSWEMRRREYANWNLAAGDGIAHERVFQIHVPQISLAKLEAYLIRKSPFPTAARKEWFAAPFDGFVAFVEGVLRDNSIAYKIRENEKEKVA